MAEITVPRIYGPDDKRPVECNRFLNNYPVAGYHSDREAVSQGCLSKVVFQSPAHFLTEWAKPYVESSDNSPAMRTGTITHHALLEPEVYKRYLLQPNLGDGRTKAGKAAKAEWLASLPAEWLDVVTDEETGKETKTVNGKALIMTPWEKAAVESMANNVMSHPRVKALGLFGQGMLTEQTVFWTDPITGVMQRARLDGVDRARRIVADLKTTESARKADFSRRLNDNRYHFQGAHYVEAAKTCDVADPFYVFVVVEREPPYAVGVYNLLPRALQVGEALRRQALNTLRDCITNNVWPAYSDNVEDIDLPPYAYSQLPTIEATF